MTRPLYCILILVLVSCSRETAPEQGSIAFVHVNIIDVEKGIVVPDQTIILDAERIVAVGASDSVKVPTEGRVIDARGKFMIPGLWDSHVHLTYSGPTSLPVFVVNGVTSVRDLGSNMSDIRSWKKKIAGGRMVGPRIKASGDNIESGQWLDAANEYMRSSNLAKYHPFEIAPRLRIDKPSDVLRTIDTLIYGGSDVVKFRNLGGENFLALAAESKRRQIPVVGHAPKELSLAQASDAGMASIEHGETISNRLAGMDTIQIAAQFRSLALNQTMITPTLITDYKMKLSSNEDIKTAIDDSVGNADPRNALISSALRNMWRLGYDSKVGDDTDWTVFLRESSGHLRIAHKMGVLMLVGTDLGVMLIYPGSSVQEEMILMAENIGMSPSEVLRAATIHPAKFFHLEDSLGAIRVNMLADLVVLDANPLADLRNVKAINAVVVNGVYFDRASLDKLQSESVKSLSSGSYKAP